MAWNNAVQNGRFGPFGGGGAQPLASGLPPAGQGISPPATAPVTAPVTPTASTYSVIPPNTMPGGPARGGGGGAAGSFAPAGMGAGASTGNGANVMSAANGGAIPDPSGVAGGTVAPDLETALSTVQDALASGRQSMGLPSQLIGGSNDQLSEANNTDAQDQDADQEAHADGGAVAGAIPGAANPDEGLLLASQMQRDAAQKAQLAAKEGQGQDVLHPAGNSYARGGVIPSFDAGGDMDDPSSTPLQAPSFEDGGDMDDPSAGGMPAQPQDNATPDTPGQTTPNMQALQSYAMGAGGVSPDVAQAMEQRVDPTGQMDPSQRKMLAVAAAPDPQSKFGMIQHYRQRFNALNSFARVAAQGTQARPAHLAASTDAATRAYHNVPNGMSIHFSPAGSGHVAMTMSRYAGGKKKQKGYDDGGPVQDDPVPLDQTAANSWSAAGADLAGEASQAQGLEDQTDATMTQPGVLPSGSGDVPAPIEASPDQDNGVGEEIRHGILSIPQYLQFLQKGHFDKLMDAPDDNFWEGPTGDQQQPNAEPSTLGKPATPSPPIGAEEDQQSDQNQWGGVNGNSKPGLYGQLTPDGPGTNQPSLTPGAGGVKNPLSNRQDLTQQQSDELTQLHAQYEKDMDEDARTAHAGQDAASLAQREDRQAEERTLMNQMTSLTGERPIHATLTGFDPRIVAQANALYSPSDPRWRQFIGAAQSASMSAQNASNLAKMKGEYQVESMWGRQAGMNDRADKAHQAAMERARVIAGQRAVASGNNTVAGIAKFLVNDPNSGIIDMPTAMRTAAQLLAGMGGQGGPQAGVQPPTGQPQQPAPITGPIAVNPQTGQRMTVRNGQWVPIPAGQ